MKIIRVLIINHTSRLGGAERVLLTFLSQVESTLLEVKLASPEGPLLEEARKMSIDCFPITSEEMRSTRKSVSISDILKVVEVYRSLNKVAKDYTPDILLSNSVKAHVLANIVSRKLGVPLVIRLHDHLSTFSVLGLKMIVGPLRRAALVSCVSESVAEDVRKIAGISHNIKVCYNGVSFNHEPNDSHKPNFQIVTAGWLFPWKGFDVFIKAMELLADRLSEEWQFVIAGDVAGDVSESITYKELLIQAVNTSKWKHRFVLTGAYHKMSDIVCCAEHCIFVLPSQKPDPLPTVVLEAGAIGLPVVATNIGGAPEMIHSESTGVLTGLDANEIAEAVLTLAISLDKRIEYGEALKLSVEDRFSVQAYAKQFGTDIVSCIAK